MTAKEVASKVRHCSNKETTERVIQQAMDSARDEALEQAAGIADEYIKLTVPLTIAVRIRALKSKPAPASRTVTLNA